MMGFFYHGKSFKFLILARRVADLLKRIVVEKHQEIGDIHLIGFSLGAHLMGTIGRMMKVATKKVGRITGKTINCSIYINTVIRQYVQKILSWEKQNESKLK